MIEIKNLVKIYGEHIAVDNISFRFGENRIYGLLGPNGAGKSTIMNIITGYIGATSGDVIVGGYDILEDAERAKKIIGYMPEMPPLYLNMKVREYLKFASEIKGISKENRQIEIQKVIKLVGLSQVYNRLIKNLSKGYRQRVGLAQALLGFPKVLILDEPTAGLDPLQIIEIRKLIRKLAMEHTVILCSHIMQEVSAICDYVIIINHGKLLMNGTPSDLENQLRKNLIIDLTVKCGFEEAKSILLKMEEIDTLTLRDRQNVIFELPSNEESSLIIKTKGIDDIREKIFLAFSEMKLPILEMKLLSSSMEDLFIKLISDSSGEK